MKYNNLCNQGTLGAKIVLLLAVMTLGACVKQINQPPLDVNFIPQKGEFLSQYGDELSFDEIMEKARSVDYILIGEGHKNVVDHQVQQRVLTALASSDLSVAVGLEMVSVDMQPVLDDFAKGQVELDDLQEELQWDSKWGYPYSLFSGLFRIARSNSIPVAGLNTPTSVTRKISHDGLESLSDDEQALLPSEIVPPSNDQVPFLDMVMASHSGKDVDNQMQAERFKLVQSIWDSKMAEEAVKLHKTYNWPVLVIAGAGHVEYGWGIARRIRRSEPGAKILLVMPWRGGSFDGTEGDVFFYSPDTYISRMGVTLVDTGRGGLLVERVERESRAATYGLRPGDVLLEASGVTLDSLFSLHRAGAKVHKEDTPLIFTVRRGEDLLTLDVGKLGQGRPGKTAMQPVEDSMDTHTTPSESKGE